MDLALPQQGKTIEQLLADCVDVLKYQVKTGQSSHLRILRIFVFFLSLEP